MKGLNRFVLRKNMRIGDLEAETDRELLAKCFIDNGSIAPLMDVTLPESVVIGRTGSGKTASLLSIAKRTENYSFLNPHDISIRFLEHSDIIQFFNALGVKLDIFYRLLWRHLITVEFLRIRYGIRNKDQSDGLLATLMRITDRDPIKKEALKYFREWGDKFWIESDQRIREITKKLSNDMKAGFGASFGDLDLSFEGAKKLSSQNRVEIVQRATQVVNELQIKKLSDILELLEEEVFDDRKKRYYILIDRLDEEWAETDTRLRFIRALIEEIKTFRKIASVKIIVALRKDLLDVVFDRTRDSGFQQEKYESYLMPLQWTREDLSRLVEKRINEVFRHQYAGNIDVHFNDIFPPPRKRGGTTALAYILDRTLLRPRDVMQFVNECFLAAYEKHKVSWRHISSAEATYSQKRLKSLFEEWADVYPSLDQYIELLRGLPDVFTRSALKGDRLNRIMSGLELDAPDPCIAAVRDFCDPDKRDVTEADLLAVFLDCFYRIGAIGVKTSPVDPFLWSDYDHASLSRGELKRVTQIRIHKMLHRSLGIETPVKGVPSV